VGASWTPFIQVRSDRDHESVFVYLRQVGRDWKLLVVTMERAETAVMQLTLDADGLSRWLSDPEHHARHWNSQ
jgi:predicted phage tail protein